MKEFSEFLKISDTELQEISQLAQNYSVEAPIEEIYKVVTELDLLILIKFALQDSQVDQLCKQPIFDNYWKEIWRQCGTNTTEEALKNKLPIHEYQCQPTIHTFDFLKGIILYQEYLSIIELELQNSESIALPYLIEAVKLDYFPAHVRLNMMLVELYAEHKHEDYFFQAIKLAERAAEKYWAAGYFLLGITYIHLAQDNSFILEGFKALLIARKLVPFSEIMLNNAFQGQSLSAVTYSEIKNWDDILNYFDKVQGTLKIFEINQLYKEVNQKVDAFKEKWLEPYEEISQNPSLVSMF